MKGISPVVSAVLLIAIAVVAAAGVWFWVSPYLTEQPATKTAGSYYVRISNCNISGENVKVMLRNLGASSTKPSHTLSVYSSDRHMLNGTIDATSMASGGVYWRGFANNTPVAGVRLYVAHSDFPETHFQC